MAHSHSQGGNVVVVAEQSGMTLIPSSSPLTSLNYFDGKFLRAADLETEKRYVRMLVELSNQGGGWGVVHGLDTTLADEQTIRLGSGMAIDPQGRVLLLPSQSDVRIDQLLQESQRQTRTAKASSAGGKAATITIGGDTLATGDFDDCEDVAMTPPSQVVTGDDLWLISIGHAEALCGHEDVFGRLCDDGCVTRTDRPNRVEGIVVRATPLVLTTALLDSGVIAVDRRHLRSRVASAYFADDTKRLGSLISRAGLAADTWCLGARLDGGTAVPLAVLARSGTVTVFLDAWTARRERIEAPARRYWARRMAMRPWDQFLAQILQFQCQLHDLLGVNTDPGVGDDPCRPDHEVLRDAAKVLEDVASHYAQLLDATLKPPAAMLAAAPGAQPEAQKIDNLPGGLVRISALRDRIRTALDGALTGASTRVLIQGGVVELPPAGYLPVVPGSGMTVNEQVRRLVGEGLDLRFCVVRADYVPHALEEAQHMERISLLQGLDHPDGKPRVDILVPDGTIEQRSTQPTGIGFAMTVDMNIGSPDRAPIPESTGELMVTAAPVSNRIERSVRPSSVKVIGAGRGELRPDGAMTFCMAGASEVLRAVKAPQFLRAILGRPVDGTPASEFLATIPTRSADEQLLMASQPTLATRLRSTAGLATDYVRDLSLAERSLAGPSAAPEFRAFRAPLEPGEKRLISLWASMGIDADLRRVTPATEVPIRLDVRLVAPAGTTTSQRLELAGNLIVRRAGPTPTGRRITGVASVNTTHQGIGDQGPEPPEPRRFDLETQIDIDLSATPSLHVRMAIEKDVDFIDATWTFEPLDADVDVGRIFDEREQTVVHANAHQDPDALTPGKPLYGISFTAIQTIDAAFDDRGFKERAQKQLFGALEVPKQDLVVRATRDWVLFHRRRDITCDVETPITTVAPPRRYALYQAPVRSPEEGDQMRDALLNNKSDVIKTFDLRPVDTVVFAGGLAMLGIPDGDLRTDWQASKPAARIAVSFFADASPVDGDVLADARLDTLLGVLTRDTPLAAVSVRDTIVGVPTLMAQPGLDGVIVELTMDVQTTCARVYALEDPAPGEDLVVTDPNGKLEVKVGPESKLIPLGDVTFAQDASDIIDGSTKVAQAWRDLQHTDSPAIVVITGHGAPDPASSPISQQRAGAVADLLAIRTKVMTRVVDEPLVDCPTAIVVIAPPALDCMEVHAVDPGLFEKLKSASSNAEVQNLLAQGSKRLGDAQFQQDSSSFSTQPGDIKDTWAASGLTNDESTVVFSQKGDPRAGTAQLREARVKAVYETTGIPGAGINDTQFGDAISGPCATIMVVFSPVTVKTDCHDVWIVLKPGTFDQVLGSKTVAEADKVLTAASADSALFLGQALFESGTPNVQGDLDSIRKDFEHAHGGTPTTGAVFTLSAAAGGSPDLQAERLKTILDKLGVLDQLKVVEVDKPLADDCQAISVLFHQP